MRIKAGDNLINTVAHGNLAKYCLTELKKNCKVSVTGKLLDTKNIFIMSVKDIKLISKAW